MSSFAGYLKAKGFLDDRSFNHHTWQVVRKLLMSKTQIVALDIGTGTGAMLKRLIKAGIAENMKLTGLDSDPALIKAAASEFTAFLKNLEKRSTPKGQTIFGQHRDINVQVALIKGEIGKHSFPPNQFDLVTAHMVMDLLPLTKALNWVAVALKQGGLFYATLNYTGQIQLFPSYSDLGFEKQLLQRYHESMEQRRADQLPTGGSDCATRLFHQFHPAGFNILAYGTSNWNITPVQQCYLDQDSLVANWLLQWMVEEGRRYDAIDLENLTQWQTTRTQQLEQGELGIIVNQLDFLAEKY